MDQKREPIWERLILVAIVLVLAQTFMEDLATLTGWSAGARRALMFAGFFFDVLFTVEFVVRSYLAAATTSFKDYFLRRYGWVDFLASVPLFLLNSGPAVFAELAGGLSYVGIGGGLNVLKVIRAIRVSRILRLLRALKLFRNIKNTDSVMAQRHITAIATLSVSLFVVTLVGLSLVPVFFTVEDLETMYERQILQTIEEVDNWGLAVSPDTEQELAVLMNATAGILAVQYQGEVRYTRYSQAQFNHSFRHTDYGVFRRANHTFFFDLRPLNRGQAANNLRNFVIILVLVLGYVFWYSPRFALTVTDPIHVMHRGLIEESYNLEVAVPEELADDDIYQLANAYNTEYLPMKDRIRTTSEEEGKSTLSLTDLDDLFQ